MRMMYIIMRRFPASHEAFEEIRLSKSNPSDEKQELPWQRLADASTLGADSDDLHCLFVILEKLNSIR